MRLISFDTLMKASYAMGFVFVLTMLVTGLPYYLLPMSERPHSGMHAQLKPAGFWGHGLGVVGSAMVLLLLLYSVRKRGLLGIRFGRLRRWLDIHIFFGVMGPLLITLHTAMKFHGIVSISYFSMLAVAISGVFGRYVYMQIPRDARGHALGLAKAGERLAEIQRELVETYEVSPQTASVISEFVKADGSTGGSKIRALMSSIRQDVTLKARARNLRRRLSRGSNREPGPVIDELVHLARESLLLQRRIAFLDATSELFHHWHVFHKPFAYIMLFIMVVHVGVTVVFGYKWIF
jgi:hypothetical protein